MDQLFAWYLCVAFLVFSEHYTDALDSDYQIIVYPSDSSML